MPKRKYNTLIGLSLLFTLLISTGIFPAFAVKADTVIVPTPPAWPSYENRSYLPVVARLVASYDLLIDHVEATQAIQNPGNSVPMVEGKSVVVRVFTHTTRATPVSGVYLSVTATRNGAVLPGSPILVGPAAVPVGWSREKLSDSFNAVLPAEWLTGQVHLSIQLDTTNAFAETNEGNNNYQTDLSFRAVPALDVKIVPIEYQDPLGGGIYPPANTNFLAKGLLRVFPVSAVNITTKETMTFSTGLYYLLGWDSLLNRLTTLKKSDLAAPSRIYYGIVPVEDEAGYTWYNGGIAGIGWVGDRVSVGLANASDYGINGADIAAHEIGHNLNREHVSCGLPPGSPFDKSYPYPTTSIGQVGLNVSKMEILAPAAYSDIMGYCSPQWVSDYTYHNFLNDQVIHGVTAQAALKPQEGLLVRASISPDGQVRLEPSYQFPGLIDPPQWDSDTQVEFLDSAGNVLSTYPVKVLYASEPGIEIRSVISMTPLPNQPFSSVRLVRQGKISAEKPVLGNRLSAVAAPELSQEGDQVVLRWGDTATPAIVRYTSDRGSTWNTIGLDVLGGELAILRERLPSAPVVFEVILADAQNSRYSIEWQPGS